MSSTTTAALPAASRLKAFASDMAPGFFVSVIVAMAARFLSDHYGAPAMLMALLLGIAFNFLSEEGRCVAGINWTTKGVLRIGVALLGARISADVLIALGVERIALVVVGMVATIFFGLFAARFLGRGWRLGVLTGGAVAICGASAAMAIAAVLPKNEHSERNLSFTVLGVTVLSTIAMIAYPILCQSLGLDTQESGVFLGGTIHDVAQVVGAGFSISTETGDASTVVKLFRVTMLAPVVLCLALLFRHHAEPGGAKPPLMPTFVIAFLVLATINSFGLIPAWLSGFLGEVSRWALLIAIAAVGMKTALKKVLEVGAQAIVLIVAETLFIGGFILSGILWLV